MDGKADELLEKVFDFVTGKKGILEKREGKWRDREKAPMGLLIFFRRTLECTFQLRSKVNLAKNLSPTVFKSRRLWSFLQGAFSGSHRVLNQKCYPFYFVLVDLFVHKFIQSFWNLHAFLACTTSTLRTSMVQLHANAKNCCLLFKSATCCFHVVFLTLLQESPALSHYLLFIPFSISIMNNLRRMSLYRDS